SPRGRPHIGSVRKELLQTRVDAAQRVASGMVTYETLFKAFDILGPNRHVHRRFSAQLSECIDLCQEGARIERRIPHNERGWASLTRTDAVSPSIIPVECRMRS